MIIALMAALLAAVFAYAVERALAIGLIALLIAIAHDRANGVPPDALDAVGYAIFLFIVFAGCGAGRIAAASKKSPN